MSSVREVAVRPVGLRGWPDLVLVRLLAGKLELGLGWCLGLAGFGFELHLAAKHLLAVVEGLQSAKCFLVQVLDFHQLLVDLAALALFNLAQVVLDHLD